MFSLANRFLLGRDLDGKVYAIRDICPHRAAPLSAGQMLRENGANGPICVVQCCYHGWTFSVSGDTAGTCTSIPSLTADQPMDVEKIKVRNYAVRELQGIVWIYITADARRPTEPDHEAAYAPRHCGRSSHHRRDHGFRRPYRSCGGWPDGPRRTGLTCISNGRWRSAKSQLSKVKDFEPRDLGFSMIRHAPSKNSRAYKILGGAPATEITFRLPGIRYEHIEIGSQQVLGLTCLTPIDEKSTRITQIFWSDHGLFRLIAPIFRLGAKAFLKQDGDMVNLQNEGLKYDPGTAVDRRRRHPGQVVPATEEGMAGLARRRPDVRQPGEIRNAEVDELILGRRKPGLSLRHAAGISEGNT